MVAKKKKRPKKTKKQKTIRHKKAKKLSAIERLKQQNAYLQRKLARYERQRFIGPLEPGKKRRKVPRTEIDAVRTKLKVFLEESKRNLVPQEIAAKYRSYENEDQSIDAEIRIPVENHGDVESHLIDVEDSANWNSLNDYWIMIGLQLRADEKTGSPTIDKRPQRAWTNPIRGNRSGNAFFVARETVVRNVEQWGAEVAGVVIRIFWHPENERPRRPRK